MAETSLKQMFQSMIPAGSAVLQGTVTKADPLEITAENDSKLIISGNQLIVPWHLTDYTTHADYTMGTGASCGMKHTRKLTAAICMSILAVATHPKSSTSTMSKS